MSINAQSITLQWDDGSFAFKQLNFQLSSGFHALVGPNGSGKSSFSKVLAGDPMLSAKLVEGHVYRQGDTVYVAQHVAIPAVTVADFLGISEKLAALERLEAGSVRAEDFEIVQDDWLLKTETLEQLSAIGVASRPALLQQPLKCLSGGEFMRLRLLRAFHQKPCHLILDEPSNHLDQQGRAWLLEQCLNYLADATRSLLLVSHDRALLSHVDSITELSQKGLDTYLGNYDTYMMLAAQQAEAAKRELKDALKHKRQLHKTVQRTREKAQQRNSQGKRQRQRGGQAKVLLDFSKNNAQKTNQALKIRHERQQKQVEQALSRAQARVDASEQVVLQFFHPDNAKVKEILHCGQLVLPFGTQQPINLTLASKDKIRITGRNGSGKSTFLSVVQGRLLARAGALKIACNVHLLDQDFSLIDESQTLLGNLLRYAKGISVTMARTRLAQAGLYADMMEKPVAYLSGGEKMKLAVLMVTLPSLECETPQLIILDEPDNHLDLGAKRQLAHSIHAYQGAVILVSHDDYFAKACGIARNLSLD